MSAKKTPAYHVRATLAFAVIGALLAVTYLLNPNFFKALRAESAMVNNVSGWAWGENVGWMSFNSVDCDSDNDGFVDVFCGGVTNPGGVPNNGSNIPVKDYGVSVDVSTKATSSGVGAITGNAWSETIGWVSFDQADLAGCPSAPCLAQVNWANGVVTGWARALVSIGQQSGGWDGWIKLSDETGTLALWAGSGVKISANKFSGYAWGGADGSGVAGVVGWIDFEPKIGGVSVGPRIGVPPCTASAVPTNSWGSCQRIGSCSAGTDTTSGIRVGLCTGGGTVTQACGLPALTCPPVLTPPTTCPNAVCGASESIFSCPQDCKVKFIPFF